MSEGGERGVERLDAIAHRLRRECPWDREQDARSIVPHTVEEAYELADAARRGDDEQLIDELGDVLFQVVFLSLLLEERGTGDLDAVADACTEKLIRRHPHIFGPAASSSTTPGAAGRSQDVDLTSQDVLRNWDRIKAEQEGREGVFANVPETLPALLYARKVQRRAAAAGHGDEVGDLGDLVSSLAGAAAAGDDADPTSAVETREGLDRALGEALFALVDLARRLKVDPELALRDASARFIELTGLESEHRT